MLGMHTAKINITVLERTKPNSTPTMFLTGSLPVFENDIFLKYRPFPENPSNLFLLHWHEVFASFLFYITIQYLSAHFSPIVLGDAYNKLSRKTQINFDIHVVSMVQCVLSIGLLLPTWNHPHYQNRLHDPHSSILGYTPYGGFVCAISLGYFLWDLYVCLKFYSLFGVGFLFHGFAAVYVFGTSFYPFCMPWIPAFLLFELSTPFVNINWFANRLPKGTFSDKTVMINGLMLLFTFFSVRIAWGFYAVYLLAIDMFQIWDQLPWYLPVPVLALNVLLDTLNVYWFSKMVAIARKTLKKSKTD